MAREQRDLRPDAGAPETIGRWLAAMTDARRRTLSVFDGVAGDEVRLLDWVDPGGSDTIGTLLVHLAAIETSWLYSEVVLGPFPPAIAAMLPASVRDADGRLTASSGDTLQTHLHRLDTVRQALLAVYRAMPSDAFHQVRHVDAYDVTPAWVLHHLMQHEAEHRGQLIALRRRAEAALAAGSTTAGAVTEDKAGG